MDIAELRRQCAAALGTATPFDSLLRALRDYAATGGQQQSAIAVLNELRSGADEPREDALLDALDYATGFCCVERRIWTNADRANDSP